MDLGELRATVAQPVDERSLTGLVEVLIWLVQPPGFSAAQLACEPLISCAGHMPVSCTTTRASSAKTSRRSKVTRFHLDIMRCVEEVGWVVLPMPPAECDDVLAAAQ